jgi:hypothetical protein
MTRGQVARLGNGLADRFWRRVIRGTPDVCWEFTGSLIKQRYGRVCARPVWLLAHRVAFALHYGRVRDGFDVHHLCGNTRCCNPAHLREVAHDEHGALRGEPYFGPGRPLEIGR